jgi:hypothetical protein
MIRFNELSSININGNAVKSITIDGNIQQISQNLPWEGTIKYVSLGDSIASGHMIDENWENDYQYGDDGNTETTILEGTYTDLICKKLRGIYGQDNVSAVSYCRSGSMVEHPDSKNKSLWDFLNLEEHKKL